MTPATRYKVTLTVRIAPLVFLALDRVLLVLSWTGDAQNALNLAVFVLSFVIAVVLLVSARRTRKRGGSKAARPVDKSL